jgi:hypothetical protein
MHRTKLVVGSYFAILLAACGGGGGSGPQGTGKDAGTNPNPMDSSVVGAIDAGDAGSYVLDANTTLPQPEDSGGPVCLTECAADDCGKVPNGCREFLECGDCETGQVCGAGGPNKCGFPPPNECVPKSPTDACDGKCGWVSDGCSDVIQCTSDNGGASCTVGQLCENAVCTDPTPQCTPATCEQKNHLCGLDSDGCEDVIDCGPCGNQEKCNYDESGNTCVPDVPVVCTPTPDTTACAGTCGIVGDGCGEQIDCEANLATRCPDGETCGGGLLPGACGAGETCTPIAVTQACQGKCGSQSNGCGEAYECTSENGGQTCDVANGESCGGGLVPNQCGKAPCTPRTQLEACPGNANGASCGEQPDNCDGLIDCGGCHQGEQCGLFEPSICGTLPVCQPVAPETACMGKCGSVSDGCGGLYQCAIGNGGVTCTGEEYCGANSMPNRCGIPPSSCVPRDCEELGHTCGFASDGCGHVLNCWPECDGVSGNCTGSCGNASACLADSGTGEQSCISGGPTCTGSLCSTVPSSCAGNSPTTLTGTVRTPGRAGDIDQLPVPNALVYIPAEPGVALPSIFQGVQSNNTASCGRCNDEKLVADGQSVLAAAVTDYKGEFVLQGRIPVSSAFTLVIKVGKWRRVVQVPSGVSVACESRALIHEYTRLAAHRTDGLTGTHLPLVAVSTGDVDAMECVLRGIGISESEFTVPSGTGRVHMYRANGTRMPGPTCTGTYSGGTSCSANSNYGCVNNRSGCSWNNISVADTTLYASQGAINAYDMVVFDCEGTGHSVRGADPLGRVLSYVNNGGRVFASHWSYEWLDNNGTLNDASSWTNSGSATSATAYVSLPSGNTTRPRANPVKSLVYRDWLNWQGALTGSTAGMLNNLATPQLQIVDPRDVAGGTAGASTDEWMYRDSNGAKIQQLSFNTPYGAADDQICGRVAFTAFHVATNDSNTTLSTSGLYFPRECRSGALTPQEKTLAFMLFDLGACVSTGDPPQPPECEEKTVGDLCPNPNDACGFIADGCGGVVDCAGCAAGFYCDGNLCRPQQCTPASCASLGYTCGSWPDGCGGIALNSQAQAGCGECTGGQVCGLNSPGICGGCVRIPEATQCPANSCGVVSDGCGGTYNCGLCPSGFCGGSGPNRCGENMCTALTQSQACAMAMPPKNCGLVADGCGGTVNCGTCTQPDTCGGGGAPNVCGHPMCTPKTLQQACSGLSCGWVSDGCGGAINCGTCSNGGVCGGAGPNQCGGQCTPTTCDAAGAECGNIANRCGGLLSCGQCPPGETCGAAGPNQCGPGQSCTPRTCQAANATCGLIGDGCGDAIDCGTCTSPLTCGGAGTPNQCGQGTTGCNKLTCNAQQVECGAASDGCGGLLDCGACASGFFCSDGECESALN